MGYACLNTVQREIFCGVQISFCMCSLQLIHVFNFCFVHFTRKNSPIITYISCFKFRSDRLRMKRMKFGPYEISRYTVLGLGCS